MQRPLPGTARIISTVRTYTISTDDGIELATGVPGAELSARALDLASAHRAVWAYDESDPDDDVGIQFGEVQW